MGWSYMHDGTRKDQIDDILRNANYENDCVASRVVTHSLRGNNLWMVIEKKDKKSGTDTRFIVLCLLQSGRRYGCGWGYKDMDEGMGPVAVNCPLSYLDLCTAPMNDYASKWRDRVREYHATQSKQRAASKILIPGAKFELRSGYRPQGTYYVAPTPQNVIIGKRRSGVSAYGPDGRLYRVTPKHINPDTIVLPA
jgi:hypothetical protein